MSQSPISKAAASMGRRSYQVRLERFGLKRLQEIARENGKKGGRPVGSGKTHILHAIGNAMNAVVGSAVQIISCKLLVEQILAAVNSGSLERLLQSLDHVDVILVDDIQALIAQSELQSQLLKLEK